MILICIVFVLFRTVRVQTCDQPNVACVKDSPSGNREFSSLWNLINNIEYAPDDEPIDTILIQKATNEIFDIITIDERTTLMGTKENPIVITAHPDYNGGSKPVLIFKGEAEDSLIAIHKPYFVISDLELFVASDLVGNTKHLIFVGEKSRGKVTLENLDIIMESGDSLYPASAIYVKCEIDCDDENFDSVLIKNIDLQCSEITPYEYIGITIDIEGSYATEKYRISHVKVLEPDAGHCIRHVVEILEGNNGVVEHGTFLEYYVGGCAICFRQNKADLIIFNNNTLADSDNGPSLLFTTAVDNLLLIDNNFVCTHSSVYSNPCIQVNTISALDVRGNHFISNGLVIQISDCMIPTGKNMTLFTFDNNYFNSFGEFMYVDNSGCLVPPDFPSEYYVPRWVFRNNVWARSSDVLTLYFTTDPLSEFRAEFHNNLFLYFGFFNNIVGHNCQNRMFAANGIDTFFRERSEVSYNYWPLNNAFPIVMGGSQDKGPLLENDNVHVDVEFTMLPDDKRPYPAYSRPTVDVLGRYLQGKSPTFDYNYHTVNPNPAHYSAGPFALSECGFDNEHLIQYDNLTCGCKAEEINPSHYANPPDCTECSPGFDSEVDCQVCRNHYKFNDLTGECTCEDPWDLSTDCSDCDRVKFPQIVYDSELDTCMCAVPGKESPLCEKCRLGFDKKKGCTKCSFGFYYDESEKRCYGPFSSKQEAIATLFSIIGGVVLLCCIICCLILCIFAIVLCVRKGVKEKREGRDIELRGEEDEEETRYSANFSVNEKLLVINPEEIKMTQQIGSGGGGATVYKAEWEGQIVAYKVFSRPIEMSDNDYTEFEKEVGLMSSISHPNILRFYGCTLMKPRLGIVMELASNGDLASFLCKAGKEFDLDERLGILHGTAKGMEYLHRRNIIHRDLKPENILIDDKFVPKIIDFGLSRVISKNKNIQMTRAIGTTYYISPEVISGTKSYDAKPYGPPKEIQGSLEFKVANDKNFRPKIPNETEVPRWLLKLMQSGWSADPKKRPTMSQIIKDFGENLSTL